MSAKHDLMKTRVQRQASQHRQVVRLRAQLAAATKRAEKAEEEKQIREVWWISTKQRASAAETEASLLEDKLEAAEAEIERLMAEREALEDALPVEPCREDHGNSTADGVCHQTHLLAPLVERLRSRLEAAERFSKALLKAKAALAFVEANTVPTYAALEKARAARAAVEEALGSGRELGE